MFAACPQKRRECSEKSATNRMPQWAMDHLFKDTRRAYCAHIWGKSNIMQNLNRPYNVFGVFVHIQVWIKMHVYTPEKKKLYSPQQPDVKHFPVKSLRRYLRAFVADWSKEFHFKERLQHFLISYDRERHIHVDIQVPKNMVHVPTYLRSK